MEHARRTRSASSPAPPAASGRASADALRRRRREGDAGRPRARRRSTPRCSRCPSGRGDARMLADVADATATRGLRRCHGRRAGAPIDVLFSNAGISGVIRPVTDYPEDVFDAVMAVNLQGLVPRLQVRPAEDARRRQHRHDLERGRRHQRSRDLRPTPPPSTRVIGLMRTVAKEAAPRRIRVNVVAPGRSTTTSSATSRTASAAATGHATHGKFLERHHPARPARTAEEVAETVLFLASDQSSFSTGSVFMADGGMHI